MQVQIDAIKGTQVRFVERDDLYEIRAKLVDTVDTMSFKMLESKV